MLCEKCGQEGDVVTCQQCGETILRLGSFCYKCGTPLSAVETTENESPEESEFSDRILCSDGTCIGVINQEGICKVCGKPYSPDA